MSDVIARRLQVRLPQRQSAFLWGPRKTGKSTLLSMQFSSSIVYDLLQTDLAISLAKRPSLLREQLLARKPSELATPVIIDEVQKVPPVLDEVQWLMENRGLRFILCGSSARKLKRGRANLLGGRAWRYELFPFVSAELGSLDLVRVLNRGMIPAHLARRRHQGAPLATVPRDALGRPDRFLVPAMAEAMAGRRLPSAQVTAA